MTNIHVLTHQHSYAHPFDKRYFKKYRRLLRAYSVLKNFLAGLESPNEREDQTNEDVNIMKNNDNCSKGDFFVKEDKRAKKTG